MRSVTCINPTNNFSITFGENSFSPFLLASITGIYSSSNEVTIVKNTMTDGGTYQGSTAKTRNIILTLLDNPVNFIYNQDSRQILYALFRKGEKGTLIYTENDRSLAIDYYSESVTRAPRGSRAFTISLLCENSFFREMTPNNVFMSNWIDDFEFVHEFIEEGEEFGYRSPERLVNIINDFAASNIGLTITVNASGPVTNPSIARIESDERIKIGSDSNKFIMENGDVLTITTGLNNKHVKLTRRGVITEVNEYLTEDSEFIQLQYGNNNIAYSADSGEDFISVQISYTFLYEGA